MPGISLEAIKCEPYILIQVDKSYFNSKLLIVKIAATQMEETDNSIAKYI